MIHRNLLMLLTILFLLVYLQILHAGPSTIIFTEVFYDNPGDDSKEEWFELYNATNNTIDISDYTIHDNSTSYFTIPTGSMIFAGAVLVFAKDNDGFHTLYGFYPDFENIPFGLNNSGGDFLTLKNPIGELVDIVAWENEIPGWNIEATTGQTLQRISFGQAVNNWKVQTIPDPGNSAPIPEPSSVILLSFGLSLFFLKRYLMKK